MKIALLASAIAIGLAAPASAAISIGDTLKIEYNYPTLVSVYATSGTFTYTGAGQTVVSAGITAVILGNNSVIFSNNQGLDGNDFLSSSYNGPVLTNLTNGSAFSGWTVTSFTQPYTSALLSGSAIGINIAGQTYNGGSVTISGAVPEASTWTMLIAGFGLIGLAARRRRVAVAA